MTATRTGSLGYRQSRFALDDVHQARLMRLFRMNGIGKTARILGCSENTAETLRSGGFTTKATVERLSDALDRIAAERALSIVRSG